MKEHSLPPGLISGLTSEESKLVLHSAERRRFRANHVIVNSGSPATSLFQLAAGTAKYYRVTKKGDEVLLWWLAAGDTFGMGTLLAKPIPYIGTAQAVDDCEVLVWSRETIRSLAAKYELLTENVLQIVIYYLTEYADRLVGLATDTAEHRLARALLQLSRRAGRVHDRGVEVTITNEDLGRLANVSAFTASRLLKKWERQRSVQKSRGKIRVLSPEGLLSD